MCKNTVKRYLELLEKLFANEIKWRKTRVKAPKDWQRSYPDAGFEIINRDNYLQFIQ